MVRATLSVLALSAIAACAGLRRPEPSTVPRDGCARSSFFGRPGTPQVVIATRDRTGRPLVNATLRLFDAPEACLRRVVWQGKTDARGYATARVQGEGVHWLEAELIGFLDQHHELALYVDLVDTLVVTLAPFNVRVEPAGRP